jgi:hypothetical protein
MSKPARRRLRPAAIPVCLVLGGLLGAGWDQLHVQAETLRYTNTAIAGQAWWVPLQFGLVYAVGIPIFVAAGDPAPTRDTPRLLGGELVWATACYAVTAFFDSMPWVAFGILAAAALSRAGTLKLNLEANFVPALTLIVLGPVTEAMLSASGVFEYTTTQLGPIPAWLPLLYVNVVPFVVRASEATLAVFGRRSPTAA